MIHRYCYSENGHDEAISRQASLLLQFSAHYLLWANWSPVCPSGWKHSFQGRATEISFCGYLHLNEVDKTTVTNFYSRAQGPATHAAAHSREYIGSDNTWARQ